MTSPLPDATSRPCNDCPWRREAAPGWLGPHDAKTWVQMAHGETAIACHLTITDESWDDPGMRQCKGAAIYRANVGKLPRSHEVTRASADREKIFSSPMQFTDHHTIKD